jgi:hypothetical protein
MLFRLNMVSPLHKTVKRYSRFGISNSGKDYATPKLRGIAAADQLIALNEKNNWSRPGPSVELRGGPGKAKRLPIG